MTVERLGSYLAASGQDLERAFQLYEWNLRASAGVLTTVALVEVVVRNALDERLREWVGRRQPGRSWFDAAPLDERGTADVVAARERATRRGRQQEVHGKVIAELPLGFWRYLVASRYLTSLWVPATHAAFPGGAGDLRHRRAAVEARLQRLAFVRNRAAHHEPIHRRSLDQDLAAAVELTRWICSDAAAWVAARSPLGQLVRDRP
ncbi:MAG TPA: hypothetical protein VLJ59_06615 [Mycobacteriales bacterium]|nr:hypothetical protein [Mycobacteriales bacterium]